MYTAVHTMYTSVHISDYLGNFPSAFTQNDPVPCNQEPDEFQNSKLSGKTIL